MYQLLTGKQAFKGKTIEEIFKQILKGNYVKTSDS
jgi:hypothetical protein